MDALTTNTYIGCNVCRGNSYPEINKDDTLGFYVQSCASKAQSKLDLEALNAPCDEAGYILRMDGYFIEEEQQLVCTACSEIIPNCQVCTSDQVCVVCESGYTPTDIYGSDGVNRPVCLLDFCGIKGYGDLCIDMSSDEEENKESVYPSNCKRAESWTIESGKEVQTYYSCI